jgi:hypothetical protein
LGLLAERPYLPEQHKTKQGSGFPAILPIERTGSANYFLEEAPFFTQTMNENCLSIYGGIFQEARLKQGTSKEGARIKQGRFKQESPVSPILIPHIIWGGHLLQ